MKSFLADPMAEVNRLPASESDRQHLIDHIRRYQCDVKYVVERKGSPFSLVLTKTSDSHERAVKEYEKKVGLLEELSIR